MSRPLCREDDLGAPLPDSPHAVSVCLPTWRDNIGYEEADPRVIDRLQGGYPRFVLHKKVLRLFEVAAEHADVDAGGCFVFPSRESAARAAEYARLHDASQADIHPLPDCQVCAVTVLPENRSLLMQYWQHSGEIVSSRLAEDSLAILESQRSSSRDASREQGSVDTKAATIRQRIAELTDGHIDDVYLFPTGMAAIYSGWRCMQSYRPGPTVQFGFPYVDILKIQQRFGAGVQFFPLGTNEELHELDTHLSHQQCSGIFTEFPGNPLLVSPNLEELNRLAELHQIPVLVDDTLAALTNLDLQQHCDLLATSLTKYFSGVGDVMGGSLVLNRNRPLYSQLKPALDELYEDMCYGPDLDVLEQNSRDCVERVRQINDTTLQICETLKAHPLVRELNYPAFRSSDLYERHRKSDGGWGGLFSIQLEDEAVTAPAFFDRLEISKGPNLGTNFSLCCPYTILAHYDELDFATECGISPHLIRVSIGLEPAEQVTEWFLDALNHARS